MELLKQGLVRFTRLTMDEIRPVLEFFRPLQCSSRQILLSPGTVSKEVWFVTQGLLRSYSLVEESKRILSQKEDVLAREVTNWIVPEGGFLTDIRSFLYQIPASHFVETLEPCQLYALSYRDYEKLHLHLPLLTGGLFEHTLVMADMRVQMSSKGVSR